MTTTATTATAAPETSAAALLEMARYEMKGLRRAYNRTVKWHTAVDAYSAGTAAYPDLKGLPSKDHKHRMYASADRVRRLLKLEMERPTSLAGIGALIAEAAKRL